MVSGTGMRLRNKAQWNRGRVCCHFGAPLSDSLLSGFLELQHVDAIIKIKVDIKTLLQSEERNNTVLKNG